MGDSALGLLRRILRDTRGSITVEFAVTIPILVAVLIFATQYGAAMRVRNAIDVAARDAARFLARAPLDTNGQVDASFVCTAEWIIQLRLLTYVDFSNGGSCATQTGDAINPADYSLVETAPNRAPGTITINTSATSTSVVISAGVDLPLANWINTYSANEPYDQQVTYAEVDGQQVLQASTKEAFTGQSFLVMTSSETWPRTQRQ